ncbi:MAG TPA: signal peptidase I [Steroidobacteraceae bacterium]|nr:signal peptidase I [Steroidobacteraceae bacterium]
MRRWLIAVSIAALAAISVHFDIVRVSRNSMAATYCDGDLLVATSATPGRSLRGKVVVVSHPTYGQLLKRVVAEGRDHIRAENGVIFINDKQVPRAVTACLDRRVRNENWRSIDGLFDVKEYIIPDGQIYVLGDNQAMSTDSRIFGTIDRRLVVDVVAFRLLNRSPSTCKCAA